MVSQDAHEGITNGSSPPPENANELQLNVKLFLREYNQEVASEAINYLVSRLGKCIVHCNSYAIALLMLRFICLSKWIPF